MATSSPRGIVVFSGGSAANNLVDVFSELAQQKQCPLSYIIPISDNGGSSSELIRVFGGPGIGDIRSRLVRLIPPTHTPIRTLFNHRLQPSPIPASTEWLTIVSGTHPLWDPIPTPQRELIRSMLLHLNLEILKRARPPHSTFNFTSASIGNMFLTGARLFSGSFESSIYLLSLIGGVNPSLVAVIPAVNSNFTHHISAGLEDGSVITGQNSISHPSAPTAVPSDPNNQPTPPQTTTATNHIEDALPPFSLPTLSHPQITISKTRFSPLPSPIQRIWYINTYGQEIHPSANPKALETLSRAEAVIFSIGSLWTSIAPSLVLRGVGAALSGSGSGSDSVNYSSGGDAMSAGGPKAKILLLNGSLDRETGGMDAAGFIGAVVQAAEESKGVCPLSQLSQTSVSSCSVAATRSPSLSHSTVRQYVTHLIHMEGDGVPAVDSTVLGGWGVEGVRVYGRRRGEDGKMAYDDRALGQALEAIVGGGRRRRREGSRRNTVEM